MLDLPPTHYQRAVTAIHQFISSEQRFSLQKGSESRVWLHPDTPSKGTLVMYHGFTAGTWQYEFLAAKAFKAGYNVFVPRLPGHGKKDRTGDEDPSELLTGPQWREYQRFGDQTMELARGLGAPIGVLGLSVGGNVALDVAERHTCIQRTVAFAPFLWPTHERVSRLFTLIAAFDFLFPDRAGPSLNGFTHSWGPECRQETIRGERPGHSYFPASAAYAAAIYGRTVIAAARRANSPLQMFLTANDDAAEETANREVEKNWGHPQHAIYKFGESEGVPHPMVHPREDRGRGHTPRLYDLTLRFLDDGRPVSRE
ncbi:MAG: alpha/beta fold hydrolase [Candidatus Sericytochromatia bacterium]|nr:alpha/beta fold hydrolase [Candidatus Sericytochromatia bacterium]